MSAPDEDFVQRSRSIFERLRAEQEGPDAEDGAAAGVDDAAGETDATDGAVPEGATAPSEDAGEERDVADTVLEQTVNLGGELGHVQAASTGEPPASGADVADDAPAESAETSVLSEPVDGAGNAARSAVVAEEIPGADDMLSVTTPQQGEELVAEGVTVAGDVEQPGDTIVSDAPAPDIAPNTIPEEAHAAPEPPTLPDPDRFRRPLPRVLAIANQKGGVGKTTTTVNLGASLAVLGFRVLVVDLDPQGNATTGLGINSRNLEASIYDVILHDTPLEDAVEPTSLRNLFVAPATIDLAGAEIELVPAFSRELRLRRALEEVRDNYDFVLIDCPPSLGLLTVNALSAASEVVVPIQCEYYALEGLGQLLRNINLVQANLNPKLELSAIILTMYDARTKLAEQVADEVRQHFGDRVCRNVVPRTVRLSEAPSFGQPIIVFDPSSRGALAYRELAKEVSGGAPQRTG